MTLVVDSSVALAWVYSDEISPGTQAVLEQVVSEGAWVPALWHLEVANSLTAAVRRKRIDARYRDQALSDLARMDFKVDAETSRQAWSTTAQLADRHRLTLYDAAYLELALRVGLPLATLDEELRQAARSEGLPYLPA